MYYQVDDDTRARVCLRVCALCVCVCLNLHNHFNVNLIMIWTRGLKKKRKKKIVQSLDNSDTSVFVLLRRRW